MKRPFITLSQCLIGFILTLALFACEVPVEPPGGDAPLVTTRYGEMEGPLSKHYRPPGDDKQDPGTTVLRVQGDTTVVDRATGKPVDGLLEFEESNGVVKLTFYIIEY